MRYSKIYPSHCWIVLIFTVLAQFRFGYSDLCGCKKVRPCYERMIQELQRGDEVACVERASVGSSTVLVYLRALKEYCSEFIEVKWDHTTSQKRPLYEVVISATASSNEDCQDKPAFIIDAGQDGSVDTVRMALYLIQQLVACAESTTMIQKYRWVILPSTNPDGLEYSRIQDPRWKKNLRKLSGGLGLGVDITRNFDSQWSACGSDGNIFSPEYNGDVAASELETCFVQTVINKYKKHAKAYVSMRGDGHQILYPKAAKNETYEKANCAGVVTLASNIATKVNMRAGVIQLFVNDSIYHANGKPYCGHSVDYAVEQGIKYAYEMRVSLGEDILLKFHVLPRGFDNRRFTGYHAGLKEIYNYFVGLDNKKNEW